MVERNETISPLRQRMLEVMRLRRLPPNTRTSYIREMKRSAGVRCILRPANHYGTPIPYSRAVWLRSSL